MEFNKHYYTRYKKVQIYPGDTYHKYGRIINVDDFGITYEVTEASRDCDKGIFFCNHATQFTFKVIEGE